MPVEPPSQRGNTKRERMQEFIPEHMKSPKDVLNPLDYQIKEVSGKTTQVNTVYNTPIKPEQFSSGFFEDEWVSSSLSLIHI